MLIHLSCNTCLVYRSVRIGDVVVNSIAEYIHILIVRLARETAYLVCK